MTVKDLIRRLMDFDLNKEVYVRYIKGDSYGGCQYEDYWLDGDDRITSDEYLNAIIDITDDV